MIAPTNRKPNKSVPSIGAANIRRAAYTKMNRAVPPATPLLVLPNSPWLARRARGITLLGMADVTEILQAIDRGEPQAASRLLPLVYDELRRLAVFTAGSPGPNEKCARRHRRNRHGPTLARRG